MGSINEMVLEFACRFAGEVNAKAILLFSEVAQDMPFDDKSKPYCDTILITRGDDEVPKNLRTIPQVINIPHVSLTRMSQMKIAITKGIAAGYFGGGDKILCLTGIPKFGYVDSIFIVDVGREFEILTSEDTADIFEGVYPEVFETVLNIAVELAAQGREGRPVGTIFILGDDEKVMQLSRQMIINPFKGYDEDVRNIIDQSLRETIKEFSALDGAFVIRGDGVLLTAGRHLSAAFEGKDFPKGLGSRHIAAAGITSVTNAIAFVVSESTGTVRIFKNGKIVVDIEKGLE
ncbi:MAG: diadenylate cyclase [Deltaproteobacteria bacterium]|nr:diadenylate cyclase [Deltaproteobacteria bacterium]MBN2688500.1 diadenylate cyclase [Deltaproteobacteria bacterium]